MADSTITSRRHALVSRCRDAADGRADEVLLDGPHLVADALDAGLSLAAVLVAEGAEDRREIADLVRSAEARHSPVHHVTLAVLDAASPTRTPVGILALASLALHELPRLIEPSPALVTVAVGVQDPGNLGTLVRSSEAAGATGLIAAGSSAHPFGWKALRGSMGSALRLPIARAVEAEATVDALRSLGVTLVALAADADLTPDAVDFTAPTALLAGAEGAGLPASLHQRADLHIRIPMRPPVESLNVGVATSLVLFEAMRQRTARPAAALAARSRS